MGLSGKHYIDITFTAKIDLGKPKIMEASKITGLGWYDFHKLPTPLFKLIITAFEALKSNQRIFEIGIRPSTNQKRWQKAYLSS